MTSCFVLFFKIALAMFIVLKCHILGWHLYFYKNIAFFIATLFIVDSEMAWVVLTSRAQSAFQPMNNESSHYLCPLQFQSLCNITAQGFTSLVNVLFWPVVFTVQIPSLSSCCWLGILLFCWVQLWIQKLLSLSLPTWVPPLSFPCPRFLLSTPSSVLNRSGKIWGTLLVLALRWKPFSLSPLSSVIF